MAEALLVLVLVLCAACAAAGLEHLCFSWAAGVPGLELELVACLWDSFALPVLLQPLLDQQRQSLGQAAGKPRPGGEPPCTHAVPLEVCSSARPEDWPSSLRFRLLRFCQYQDWQLGCFGADVKVPPCSVHGQGVA